VHKVANVLAALPKSANPSARRALAEIRDAEDRSHAEAAMTSFADAFSTKWPKATAKIVDDKDTLLRFFDFPAEHWIHLKTTNPIVIWSRPKGVFHVVEGPLHRFGRRAGRAYLLPSGTRVPGRFGVRSAGSAA
jgi:hypothetical protein